MRKRRFNLRTLSRLLAVVLLGSTVFGCPEKSKQGRVVAGKPALELKKVISFPLTGGGMPASEQALIEAITGGLSGRVKLPAGSAAVVAEGSSYPALHKLTVDLTNAGIDTGRKLPKLKPTGKIESGVRAERFRFVALPMKVDGANIDLDINARDVKLGLQRDKNGQPILVLAEAKDGQVRCDTTNKDLSRIFQSSANERGKPYGLSVQKAKVQLASDNGHDVRADLRLSSRLLLVPISLHFTARADVDANGNATLSNLTCDGDDVAGWLITQFIRPSLAEYDRKTMPLIAFPTDKIRLHDLRLHIDGDDIHVVGAFGS